MPQQINLLTPILLAPRRYFSATTLAQASGLLLLAGVAAVLWLQHRERGAEAEHQALLARHNAERQALAVAQAGLPPPLDATALQQQLLPLQAGNAERRALLRTLGTDGHAGPGQRHSDLLGLVAQSLPESAWLTELRYAPGRLELVGGTLDTGVLRAWLGRLGGHPLLAGQTLAALRVERLGASSAEANLPPLLDRQDALGGAPLPVWGFRVVSAPAAAASEPGGAP